MASTATEPEKVAAEQHQEKAAAPPAGKDHFALVDVVLRFLLFASGLAAVVVTVTSQEEKAVGQSLFPPFEVDYRTAKFNHSPAFIFFVAALSVAGFYGLITTLVSFFALLKPGNHTRLISHFIIFDIVLLGIVSSAIGAAGGVAYVGLKGNKHVQWNKICYLYGGFCRHIGAALGVSLVGSVVLVLLVVLSVYSLSKKIPKHNHSH